MVGMGELTPIVIVAVPPLQAFKLQNAEYVVVFVGETFTLLPFAPISRMMFPLQPLAETVTLSPVFIFVLVADRVGVDGRGLILTRIVSICPIEFNEANSRSKNIMIFFIILN